VNEPLDLSTLPKAPVRANPLMKPVDLLERARPWVSAGIQLNMLGQPVRFAVTFGIAPGPDGQPLPRIMIYFEVDSGIIGPNGKFQTLGHVVMCDTNIDRARVEEVCKLGVEAVMAMRSESLRM